MATNRIYHPNSGYFWDFISIKGNPDLPGMALKPIEKAGVDGIAFKEMEFRAEPTPLYLKALADDAAAATLLVSDMKNIQGTQVDVHTSSGTIYYNVVVLSSRLVHRKFVGNPIWLGVNRTSGIRLNFALVVQYPYGGF